jgi:hypothetical protein
VSVVTRQGAVSRVGLHTGRDLCHEVILCSLVDWLACLVEESGVRICFGELAKVGLLISTESSPSQLLPSRVVDRHGLLARQIDQRAQQIGACGRAALPLLRLRWPTAVAAERRV